MNVGALVFDTSTQWHMRAVAVDPDYVYLMPIGIANQWTIRRSMRYANEMLANKTWESLKGYDEVSTTKDGITTLPRCTTGAMRRGDQLFNRLFAKLIDVSSLLTSEGRASLYRRLRETDNKLSKQTYYSALRRWLEGGLTISTLHARWKGNIRAVNLESIEEIDFPSARRKVQEISRALQQLGAPKSDRKAETNEGQIRRRAAPYAPTRFKCNNRETIRVFSEFYKRKNDPSCGSLDSLHEDMIREVFSTPQPFGPSIRWPLWSIPSKTQFSFYWRKLHNMEDRKKLLNGKQTFELTSRALRGQQVSEAFTAGRIGQIDATVWNVDLVGDDRGAPLIGPPVVFRIRCIDTGQLLGLSVSLENASFNNAAMAIVNCLEDKAAYCKSLDVYHAALPWEVRGLPSQIDADQGETYNSKPTAFIRFTGVSITNMPGGRGDMKAGVESDFNTLQVQLSPLTPGALIKAYEKEHKIKWHMAGTMTVRAFTRALVLQELKRMHTPRNEVRLPTAMQDGQTNTSSHSMFHWGLRNGGGGLRMFDNKLARLSLLPRKAASIDDFGVLFNNVHFECSPLAATAATVSAKVRGRPKAWVAYDPLLAGIIWLIVGSPDAPTKYIDCVLSQRFVYQRGYEKMSWREIQMRREATVEVNIKHRDAISEALAMATDQQRQIADESSQWTKEQRRLQPTTERQLLQNMPRARTNEKNKDAPRVAVSAPLQDSAVTVEPTDSLSRSNVIALPSASALKKSSHPTLPSKPIEQTVSSKHDSLNPSEDDEYAKLLDYFGPVVPASSTGETP